LIRAANLATKEYVCDTLKYMRFNFLIFFISVFLASISKVTYSQSLDQGAKIIGGYKFEIQSPERAAVIEKLINQLENYESYRPDSYSDLTRNPFRPRRYKAKDLLIELEEKLN